MRACSRARYHRYCCYYDMLVVRSARGTKINSTTVSFFPHDTVYAIRLLRSAPRVTRVVSHRCDSDAPSIRTRNRTRGDNDPPSMAIPSCYRRVVARAGTVRTRRSVARRSPLLEPPDRFRKPYSARRTTITLREPFGDCSGRWEIATSVPRASRELATVPVRVRMRNVNARRTGTGTVRRQRAMRN